MSLPFLVQRASVSFWAFLCLFSSLSHSSGTLPSLIFAFSSGVLRWRETSTAEIVKALQNEDLGHQDEIVSWASSMFYRLGCKVFLEFRTEVLPVDDLVQTGRRSPRIVRRLRRFCSSKMISPKSPSCIAIVACSFGFMFVLLVRFYSSV